MSQNFRPRTLRHLIKDRAAAVAAELDNLRATMRKGYWRPEAWLSRDGPDRRLRTCSLRMTSVDHDCGLNLEARRPAAGLRVRTRASQVSVGWWRGRCMPSCRQRHAGRGGQPHDRDGAGRRAAARPVPCPGAPCVAADAARSRRTEARPDEPAGHRTGGNRPGVPARGDVSRAHRPHPRRPGRGRCACWRRPGHRRCSGRRS
jgi:hypothetical protein